MKSHLAKLGVSKRQGRGGGRSAGVGHLAHSAVREEEAQAETRDPTSRSHLHGTCSASSPGSAPGPSWLVVTQTCTKGGGVP